jgi:ABC-2 type transport system permease protein
MKAFLHHLGYDFRTGIRDRTQLLMNYLLPLGFFLLVSGLMVGVNPLFKDLMLPAMTVFAVMSAALLSLPSTLVSARESGVFRSFRINGVPSGSLLAIPPLGGLVHMAVVAVIIAVLGPRMYGGSAPGSIAGYAAAGLLSYASMASVGALIGVAAANDRSTIMIGQFLYLPSILLGGLMVPAAALPPALARASLLLPASHAMRAFQALGMKPGSGPFPWVSVAALATGTVLCFALAALLFQWDSRMSQPNRKAVLAVLGIVPYAIAAVIG